MSNYWILISEPVFSVTKAGNPVIIIGTYRYNIAGNTKGPKVRWVCTKACIGCRSTIITIDNVIFHHKTDHNH